MKKITMFIFGLVMLLLSGCSTQKTHSISIIDGSDGPTVIFFTGNSVFVIGLIVVGITILISIIVFILKGRRNKK